LAYSTALKAALATLRNFAMPLGAQQVEPVLRVARVTLAVVFLVTIRFVVGASGAGLRPAIFSGAAYLIYSLMLWLWVRNRSSPSWLFVFHGVDVVWVASLPILTGNYHVPFSVFFLFVLLSAAYRWGFWGALATVASMIGLLLLDAGLPALAGSRAVVGMPDNLPAQAIAWVVMGSLVGFLGERQRAFREGALVSSRLLADADLEAETRPMMGGAFGKTLELLDAKGVLPAARRMRLRQGPGLEAEVAASALLARELHDGIVQTLAAVEMRMEALRRNPSVAPAAAEELAVIQELLHREMVGMRDLVHSLRSRSRAPIHLVDSLRAIVAGFREETGIAASFVSPCKEINLPPVVCREVAQILREALVNVRKHSGAHKVEVRLEQQNAHCKLLIDDDGRGFDFAGQRSLAELETSCQGPWVIKERVRMIRGELTLDSKPGRGSRLEIAVPTRGL
jgi:signal transduction histidine kinase